MTDENDKRRLCVAADFRSAQVHLAQEESGAGLSGYNVASYNCLLPDLS